MRKTDYYHLHYLDFLEATQHLTLAAIGAFQILCSEAWKRWKPEQHPFPFLPNDEKELERMTRTGAKSWWRVRTQVLALFTQEDGKLFYQPHREAGERLVKWRAKKAERDKAKSDGVRPMKPVPPVPEKLWGQVPKADAKGQQIVYGVQGRRAVGADQLRRLQAQPWAFVAVDCSIWILGNGSALQKNVRVIPDGQGWLIRYPDGTPVVPPKKAEQ